MATPTIFISYRREDSAGQSGRIFDRLVQQYGKKYIYRDIESIPAGEDFVEAVQEKIKQSDILLVLIGTKWLTAADGEGRWRLADENDLVRVEIVTALKRNMRVIPVLLQGASIPKAKDLPGELAKLVQRNAVEIRDTNFDLDIEQLIVKIGSSWRNTFIRTFARWPVYAVIALLLASPLGFWIYPQVVLTPEKARIQIAQMGMEYTADTFIETARKGDIQAVGLFLRAGMDPNVRNNAGKSDQDRESAVMWAAAKGHLDLVRLLRAKGASLDEAMSWAIGHEQKQVLDFMFESNPEQNAINLGLLAAAGKGAIDIVRTLLDKGAESNSINRALQYAAGGYSPNIELVRLLLSKGADVNPKNGEETPLFSVAARLNVELVNLLIAHGADVNIKTSNDTTPLHVAIHSIQSEQRSEEADQKRQEVVQILLDKGADLTVIQKYRGLTPLSLAIHEELPQIALLLIARGADPNDPTGNRKFSGHNDQNYTVLMLAADNGMTDVVKALLAKGADVNARSANGWSPLLSAAAGKRGNEIIPILLDSGADARATDNGGENALMNAGYADWGASPLEEEVFKRLVNSGVQVNAVDKRGWTALMHAANAPFYEKPNLIQQLLRFGADTTMKNNVGDTALAIATKNDYKETMHLLNTHATMRHKNKGK